MKDTLTFRSSRTELCSLIIFSENPDDAGVPTKLIVRDMDEEDLNDLRAIMKQKKTSQGVQFKINVNELGDYGRVGVEIIYDKPEGTLYTMLNIWHINKFDNKADTIEIHILTTNMYKYIYSLL